MSSAAFAQDTISTEQAVEPAQELKQEQVQEQAQKPPWKDKLYFGGYVNFSFGQYPDIMKKLVMDNSGKKVLVCE